MAAICDFPPEAAIQRTTPYRSLKRSEVGACLSLWRCDFGSVGDGRLLGSAKVIGCVHIQKWVNCFRRCLKFCDPCLTAFGPALHRTLSQNSLLSISQSTRCLQSRLSLVKGRPSLQTLEAIHMSSRSKRWQKRLCCWRQLLLRTFPEGSRSAWICLPSLALP